MYLLKNHGANFSEATHISHHAFARGHHANTALPSLKATHKSAASQAENVVMMKALDGALSALQQIMNKEAKKKAEKAKNAEFVEVEQVQPPKLISFKAGGNNEHLIKAPHLPDRTLRDYLALPLDAYALLDPKWIQRDTLQPSLFHLTVPLQELVGLPLQPSICIRVDIDPQYEKVHFHADRFAIGAPQFDDNFKLELQAVLQSRAVPDVAAFPSLDFWKSTPSSRRSTTTSNDHSHVSSQHLDTAWTDKSISSVSAQYQPLTAVVEMIDTPAPKEFLSVESSLETLGAAVKDGVGDIPTASAVKDGVGDMPTASAVKDGVGDMPIASAVAQPASAILHGDDGTDSGLADSCLQLQQVVPEYNMQLTLEPYVAVVELNGFAGRQAADPDPDPEVAECLNVASHNLNFNGQSQQEVDTTILGRTDLQLQTSHTATTSVHATNVEGTDLPSDGEVQQQQLHPGCGAMMPLNEYAGSGVAGEVMSQQGNKRTLSLSKGGVVPTAVGNYLKEDAEQLARDSAVVEEEQSQESSEMIVGSSAVLWCQVDVDIQMQVPHPLSAAPRPLLSLAATLVTKFTIQQLLPAFLQLLSVDYERWASGKAGARTDAVGSLLSSRSRRSSSENVPKSEYFSSRTVDIEF